jgi:hypothetical protein
MTRMLFLLSILFASEVAPAECHPKCPGNCGCGCGPKFGIGFNTDLGGPQFKAGIGFQDPGPPRQQQPIPRTYAPSNEPTPIAENAGWQRKAAPLFSASTPKDVDIFADNDKPYLVIITDQGCVPCDIFKAEFADTTAEGARLRECYEIVLVDFEKYQNIVIKIGDKIGKKIELVPTFYVPSTGDNASGYGKGQQNNVLRRFKCPKKARTRSREESSGPTATVEIIRPVPDPISVNSNESSIQFEQLKLELLSIRSELASARAELSQNQKKPCECDTEAIANQVYERLSKYVKSEIEPPAPKPVEEKPLVRTPSLGTRPGKYYYDIVPKK